jgi:hypothetical protein
MKVKLELDLQDGRGTRTMTTNMFVVCEWEKLENRKVSDGKGIGYSDIACWAYHLCKLAGDSVPDTWREWVKQHPNMDLTSVDETNPNPTALALTEDN